MGMEGPDRHRSIAGNLDRLRDIQITYIDEG